MRHIAFDEREAPRQYPNDLPNKRVGGAWKRDPSAGRQDDLNDFEREIGAGRGADLATEIAGFRVSPLCLIAGAIDASARENLASG